MEGSAMISPKIITLLSTVFVLLVIATILSRYYKKSEIITRVNSWWVMVIIFLIATLINETTAIVFFALLSYLALKEYFTITPTRRTDRRIIFWAYLSIIGQYYFVAIGWYGLFVIWIPVYMFLFLPFRQILIGQTDGFIENTAKVQWGMMLFVFSLSHMAQLLTLQKPLSGEDILGIELLFFLVFITQSNDILQFLWGKSMGRRPIVPKISPNKTLEGLLGAMVSTALLALLMRFLTPFDIYQALLVGALISLIGFMGDVVVSMIKRDVGIKDSSNLIPGHGGILDRVDSLTFTAPLFFHYVYYLYY